MAEQDGFKLFGFEIKRANAENPAKAASIVPARDEDGAGYVTASGSHYGQYINQDGTDAKDNHALVMKYRGVAMHPEVDAAIEDITNEAIIGGENEPVTLNMDSLIAPVAIKKSIKDEFDGILSMMDFTEVGHDIFRRWYVDGRIYHHLVVDEANTKQGIIDIRPIDAARIRKVRQIKKKKDVATGAPLVKKVDEYFIYQDSNP